MPCPGISHNYFLKRSDCFAHNDDFVLLLLTGPDNFWVATTVREGNLNPKPWRRKRETTVIDFQEVIAIYR